MNKKLVDLRSEADKTTTIAMDAAKIAIKAQREVEELEQKEAWEKQKIERRKEAQSAIDNSALPKWVIQFIENEAYHRGHSVGQLEVDSYIIACISSAEEHMRKGS